MRTKEKVRRMPKDLTKAQLERVTEMINEAKAIGFLRGVIKVLELDNEGMLDSIEDGYDSFTHASSIRNNNKIIKKKRKELDKLEWAEKNE